MIIISDFKDEVQFQPELVGSCRYVSSYSFGLSYRQFVKFVESYLYGILTYQCRNVKVGALSFVVTHDTFRDKIKNLKPENGGSYECTIKNEYGLARSLAYLTVECRLC
ncbi:hypothetical protein HELRODRAFT_158990 [Helobdella robusta]|uniref:Immunoglobulin I-set domain-containing protein n=1 Tax=Helobdella robusta TaxID=6412 RepID=T1ENG5_HELRO|nr:hypothetical protein HELRODRAFT_158990 [Helobdella robusta]ESO12456.1 hypothetical protein HELRODRAFT_158990 [Helobdella robusta]